MLAGTQGPCPALYVANAFLEKMFSVDILPIVGMMTGASPLDAPPPRAAPAPAPAATAGAAPAPPPPASGEATPAFAAFMRNFG